MYIPTPVPGPVEFKKRFPECCVPCLPGHFLLPTLLGAHTIVGGDGTAKTSCRECQGVMELIDQSPEGLSFPAETR